MAKNQTRKSVSLNRRVFDLVEIEAKNRGVTMSEFVTDCIRSVVPGVPKTHHSSPGWRCECGGERVDRGVGCPRCVYLEGRPPPGKRKTAFSPADVVSALRGTSDGMSLREICEAIGCDSSINNGQRQLHRYIDELTAARRIRRYWRCDVIDDSHKTESHRHGAHMSRRTRGCWAYMLDGLTDKQWERAFPSVRANGGVGLGPASGVDAADYRSARNEPVTGNPKTRAA